MINASALSIFRAPLSSTFVSPRRARSVAITRARVSNSASVRRPSLWAGRKPRVIDDDLGLSASGYVDRPGFQELLTRVAMREVGIILCLDASRLSRNSKDWAHLFELCSYFATLIADLEQVDDLGQPNDRLLMGIKGTVSEMELTVLRARLQSGTEAKAARGELKINLPIGYVYDACDKIVVDPDERVQRAVTTVFEQLDRCCSVRQLVMWYRDHALTLPVKHVGKHEKMRWELPSHTKIRNILRHPIYAGGYVWGRRFTFIDYVDGKLIKRVSEQRAIEDSKALRRIREGNPAGNQPCPGRSECNTG